MGKLTPVADLSKDELYSMVVVLMEEVKRAAKAFEQIASFLHYQSQQAKQSDTFAKEDAATLEKLSEKATLTKDEATTFRSIVRVKERKHVEAQTLRMLEADIAKWAGKYGVGTLRYHLEDVLKKVGKSLAATGAREWEHIQELLVAVEEERYPLEKYEEDLFNEERLYEALGKEDARSVLAIWSEYRKIKEIRSRIGYIRDDFSADAETMFRYADSDIFRESLRIMRLAESAVETYENPGDLPKDRLDRRRKTFNAAVVAFRERVLRAYGEAFLTKAKIDL